MSCAEKNGQRLIAVTLQDGNDWADHQALYEFGFSAYPLRTLAVRGKTFTYLRVENGIGPLLPVTAADSFAWPTAETEEVTTELCWDAPACAPVTAGKTLGYAVFRLDGKEIGRVALLAGRTVLPEATGATTLRFWTTALPFLGATRPSIRRTGGSYGRTTAKNIICGGDLLKKGV